MRIPFSRLLALVAIVVVLPAPAALAVVTGPSGPTGAAPATSASAPTVTHAGDAATAAADKPFTFFGSGFGHGLGMSQWGAYGLALDGWHPGKIVTHYYSGTSIGNDAGPNRLRIGLVQGRSSVRLEASAGTVELRLGDANGDVVATISKGETWRVRVASNAYRIVDASGHTVDRVGGPKEPIVAVFSGGSRVRIPEAGHTYNRGSIEFGLYSCDGGCSMRLVLSISPQEYLYGLGEVPSSWPMAAMQAQAIAARTYAFTKASPTQHRPVCDCALYASSYDQVYAGWDKEGGTDGDRWVHAVDSTDGEVVEDGGDTIQAFYMSSSGGYTEDNENVWGGTPVSYLRGVCDPGDYTDANPNATWDVTMTAGEITQDLGLGIGTVTGFANAQRGISGRIVSVKVKGQDGDTSVSGTTLRSALGLNDDRVWIDANREVTGAIRAKYDALGCSPGLPNSRQVAVAGGARQNFSDGTIYVSEPTGAHEVHGAVLNAYLDEGGPAGHLGFPVTDTRTVSGGRERSGFEHGSIVCGNAGCTVRNG
jgi:SpoIID/LytB domain protein